MPNAIKYSTTGDTLSLKKGNIFFGVGDVGKGPSSATTYYNGVTPPTSGYTIYSYNSGQTSNLSFYTAVDDISLREYTNNISGGSFATAAQCLNWYATQSNYVCVNRDYEPIVTSGLTLCLDAGFTPSYSTSGTTWYDISYNGKNGTLTNGPTYSTDAGGTIVFDGIDDFVTLGSFTGNFISNPSLNNGIISFSCWVFVSNSGSYYIISSGAQTTSTGVAFSYQNGNPFVSVKGQDFTATMNISTSDFPLNNWINFTFVANGSSLVTYKNGVLLQSTNYVPATWSATATSLTIARPNNTTSLTLGGKVAFTSFYNIALSQTEITKNFNAQKSRFGL